MAWWEDSGWPDWLKVPVQAGPVEAVEHCTGWAAFVLQLVTRGSPGPRFAPWMQPSWGAIAHLECLQRQQPGAGRESPGLCSRFFFNLLHLREGEVTVPGEVVEAR